MRRTQLYLTKAQETILRRLSQERGCSISDLVREAIDRTYRPETSLEDVKRVLANTAGTWADRAEDGEAYVERLRDGSQWNRRLDEFLRGDDW